MSIIKAKAAASQVGDCRQFVGTLEPVCRSDSEIRAGKDVIQVLGYVPADQVGALFSASDLVVLPYRYFDSQSGVGAAAIAFNIPMIVTDTGGLPDLVTDPVCVVPCGDPAAWRKKS